MCVGGHVDGRTGFFRARAGQYLCTRADNTQFDPETGLNTDQHICRDAQRAFSLSHFITENSEKKRIFKTRSEPSSSFKNWFSFLKKVDSVD